MKSHVRSCLPQFTHVDACACVCEREKESMNHEESYQRTPQTLNKGYWLKEIGLDR